MQKLTDKEKLIQLLQLPKGSTIENSLEYEHLGSGEKALDHGKLSLHHCRRKSTQPCYPRYPAETEPFAPK